VNGRVEESVSSSRTVTLSTGLTIDLVKESTSTATIQVTRGTGNVKAAIDAFVNSYNGVIDELGKHYGTQNGALAGNSLIFTTNSILREISSYSTGNSGMSSLTSLGILADKSGKLYVDATEWDKVKNNVSGLQTFFGKSDVSGFLKAASGQVNALHAEQSGILTNAIKVTDEQAVSADARITEQQRRIDDLKTDLQKKFYAADALIASLEQQATYFINMFAAMKSNQESING
jgi:flagellar capping protein FliD